MERMLRVTVHIYQAIQMGAGKLQKRRKKRLDEAGKSGLPDFHTDASDIAQTKCMLTVW